MENKENNSPELKKKSHWNIRPYLAIALTAFLVITLSIIFFFLIYRYNGFAAGWRKLTVILQPIIIGIVIAYLINPIMMFFEKYLLRWIEPKIQKKDKAKKLCRSLATFGALAVFIMIIAILLILLIPQLAESIQGLVVTLPGEVQELIDKVNGILKNDSEIADMFENTLLHATDYLRNWAMNDLLPKSNQYLTSITSGLISIFKVLLNIVVGLIVSVYLLFSKETFIGQFKKLTYALFKPKRANIIIETARKSNEIFGGFISGKILDSAIIGVIAYIVLAIMKMPDTMLVAVIIGVTNIIPFFGPFIGAIPSFIIIVLQNPVQGLYFLIFVIILQQVDGNIIGPKILGDSTGLSSFWVVFAILVFGGLWGFPGMLLGVPIMAVIYYIVSNVVTYSLKKRGIPATEIDYVNLDRIDKHTNQPVYETTEKNKKQDEKSAGEA